MLVHINVMPTFQSMTLLQAIHNNGHLPRLYFSFKPKQIVVKQQIPTMEVYYVTINKKASQTIQNL